MKRLPKTPNADADALAVRLLEEADIMYGALKMQKNPDLVYVAPEQFPRISSDQVKALAYAIARVLGKGDK